MPGRPGSSSRTGRTRSAFTAAALSFLLVDLPGPVVVVGAQRSPDRPSSDGPSNLDAAVSGRARRPYRRGRGRDACGTSPIPGSRSTGPTGCEKCTRADAMRSRAATAPGSGSVEGGSVDAPGDRAPRRGRARSALRRAARHSGRIALVLPRPHARGSCAAFPRGFGAIVLAGTGLGHVGSCTLPGSATAIDRGVVVAMTTQCLAGRRGPVRLLDRPRPPDGRRPVPRRPPPRDRFAKLVWALGHGNRRPDGVRRLLRTTGAGEFVRRHSSRHAP